MPSRPRLLGSAVAVAAAVAALVSACSSGGSSTATSSSATPSADAHTMSVTISAAKGCQLSSSSYGSGALTVNIANQDATGVSEVELLSGERIVGEKENLPPGITGTFSVDLDPGTYSVYCPGAQTEKTSVTVTGQKVSSANTDTHQLLVTGTQEYAAYVHTQAQSLLDNTTTFVKSLSAENTPANVATAQNLYAKARVYYERIEPDIEAFPDLDTAIDARIDDVPSVDQWQGFHHIEMLLFQDKTLAGTPALGQTLLANVTKLQSVTQASTQYKPSDLANGAASLLDEVASTKVTGEEERYSHIDLLDFSGNVEGAQQAFADLQPGLTKIDPTLTGDVASAFTTLQGLLDQERDASQPSGYKPFTSLTKDEITKLSQATQAVQEPLSKVSSKVVSA